MYNRIWNPLKKEFVDILSADGTTSLKLYVSNIMKGGANQDSTNTTNEPNTDILDNIINITKKTSELLEEKSNVNIENPYILKDTLKDTLKEIKVQLEKLLEAIKIKN